MPNQEKNLDNYFKKLDNGLLKKRNDYEILKYLRLLGRSFKDWKTPHSANILLKDTQFRKSLTKNKQTDSTDETTHQNRLVRLRRFLHAWNDTALSRTSGEELQERQLIKFKGTLDKDDRRAIHIGLHAYTLYLTAKKTDPLFSLNTTYDLIKLVSTQIKNKELNEDLELQELEKIGLAIKSFQTPNKKKKFIKYMGIMLAFIASLACGLATGGAIILLFPSLSILALTLGGIIAFFGFVANFGFFSQNFPDFILSLFKKGGISEYIANNGQRKQFSTTYKYLLTPLAIFASLTVGAGTSALTYITVLGLAAKLLPILAIIWPPLPLIIVGVLSIAIGITLTVAIFTATLESLKKVAALNISFKALCQSTYKNCIEWFKNLKNLKTHEKVGLVIMLLLVPIGLAGLAYYRFTAGIDLSMFIGMTGAIVMGIVAYIAQMPFTCLSINKLKNGIINLFANTHQSTGSPSFKNRVKSAFRKIWYGGSLFINAGGNAALVYDGSPISIGGALSCGLNSLTGNMSEPDMNQPKRKAAIIALVVIIGNESKVFDINATTSTHDSNERKHPMSGSGYPPEPSQSFPMGGGSAPGTPIDEPPHSPINTINNSSMLFKPTANNETVKHKLVNNAQVQVGGSVEAGNASPTLITSHCA